MSSVSASDCRECEKAAFWVRVKPRSRRDEIAGRSGDGAWEIRVQAPPVKGAANESCRRLLARALDVAPSRIRIERGEGARRKKVSVEGLEPDEACRRLLTAVGDATNGKA